MVFDGHGVVRDNIMWGNLHRSTVDVGADTLAAAQVPAVPVGAPLHQAGAHDSAWSSCL